MKLYFFLFLFFYFFCKNKIKKIVYKKENSYNNEIPDDIEIPDFECKKNEIFIYDKNNNQFKCEKCLFKSNRGKDLIIKQWDNNIYNKYNIENKGWILNNYNIFSKNYNDNKLNVFKIKKYFEFNGKITFSYINYKKNKMSYLRFYINNVLKYNDINNELTYFHINKTFDVKKGENIFKFEHINNNKNSDSYIKIIYILFENVQKNSLECDEFLPIEQLNLDKCEYEQICNNSKKYCTKEFYSTEIENNCDLLTLTQNISYYKIENSKCEYLNTPPNKEIPCEHCSYGQYSDYNISNIRICKECEYNKYNDEEINDKNECKECDMKENRIENILYIRPKLPNYYNDIIGFKEIENKMKIEYEKFNEKEEMKVYIQIEEDIREYKEIIPEIEINKGNKHIIIKGKNINMKKIIFYGTERGSGYKCIPKLKSEQNENLNNDFHLDSNLFYSKVYNHYMECPLFSYKIKDYCEIYPILSNNKYLTKINYKNFQLNNKEIIIDNYKINFINGIKVYDTLNNILLGNELHEINIVKGEINLGLILTLKSNNLKSMEIYESIIYIKLSNKNKNKLVYKNKNKFYFLIETNQFTFQCVNNDFKNIFNSPCIFSRRLKIFYNNNNIIKCSLNINNKNYIENPENENLQNMFLNNNNKQHQNLIKIFNIKDIIPYYPKQNSYYLNSYFNIEKCIVPKINIKIDFKNEYLIKFYYTFCIIFIVSLIKIAFDHENAQKRKYLLKIKYKQNLFNNNKYSEIICNDILIDIINNLIKEKQNKKNKK